MRKSIGRVTTKIEECWNPIALWDIKKARARLTLIVCLAQIQLRIRTSISTNRVVIQRICFLSLVPLYGME